jgi:hypothetical protein
MSEKDYIKRCGQVADTPIYSEMLCYYLGVKFSYPDCA